MKKNIFFFLFLLGFSACALAQSQERLPCVDKKFSIVVHIVMSNSPLNNITESAVLDNVNALNSRFAPICVSFEVCEFKYIHNSYYDTVRNNNWEEMQNLYNVENRINIYYVSEIDIPSLGKADGFAGLGCITFLKSEGIVLKKTNYVKTLQHEMGHYFGLFHTFEGSGTELADGSNCASEGDGICDTPSDPFVKGEDPKSYVDASCKFISMKKDAKGQYYNPMVGNTMDYYPGKCHCGFTHDQYIKMAKTYLAKKGMW